MFLTELVCGLCGKIHATSQLQTVCQSCGPPLLAAYDLASVSAVLRKEQLASRGTSLWRYREILPLALDAEPVTLTEGWTPLLPADRLARNLDLRYVWIKDESRNPTASFKARGMSVAVSMAKQFGVKAVAVP